MVALKIVPLFPRGEFGPLGVDVPAKGRTHSDMPLCVNEVEGSIDPLRLRGLAVTEDPRMMRAPGSRMWQLIRPKNRSTKERRDGGIPLWLRQSKCPSGLFRSRSRNGIETRSKSEGQVQQYRRIVYKDKSTSESSEYLSSDRHIQVPTKPK